MYGYILIGVLALWNYNKDILDQVKQSLYWGTAIATGYVKMRLTHSQRNLDKSTSIRGPIFEFPEETNENKWTYYFVHDDECVRFNIDELDEFIHREDIRHFYVRLTTETQQPYYSFVIPREGFHSFLNKREQIQRDISSVTSVPSESVDPIIEEYKGPQGDFGLKYTGYKLRCEDIFDFTRNHFHFRGISG